MLRATKWVEQTVEFDSLQIQVPLKDDYLEDLPSPLPGYCEASEMWEVIIDLRGGQVVDWPQDIACDICIKARDSGRYRLLKHNQVIAEVDGDYVPDCVPNSYGDYIEFRIENGSIADYRIPHESKFRQFFPGPEQD